MDYVWDSDGARAKGTSRREPPQDAHMVASAANA
jgi:hypothetical protein